MQTKQRSSVAVVGSGMAGLVTAWLLKQDVSNRYDVEVFECSSEPSLDFASVSVTNDRTGEIERVDVPMRAFTEGYYHNLKAMYDYLNVQYRVQPFLFSFSRFDEKDSIFDSPGRHQKERHYFVHASNNHRLPPIRPKTVHRIAYVAEVLYALICYVWFSLCCLLVSAKCGSDDQLCESFDEYLRRIRLPRYFVRYYLLPLMSAVTTCPHKDLLRFPAKDVVDYKRCITSRRQLTATAGVNDVQRKLVKGIQVHCSSRVTAVDPQRDKVRVRWQTIDSDGKPLSSEQLFDKVVLALPPNVVGSIFEPLRKDMQCFPTIPVETIVHRDMSSVASQKCSIRDGLKTSWFTTSESDEAHVIHLRTVRGCDTRTEATHVQPSGVMVTSCPLSQTEASKVISCSHFVRVLRTPESRRATNKLFGHVGRALVNDEKRSNWANGDDGVYLVGSWCWDGMVLLEGCVVSAMRTAKALGVEVPWKEMRRNI